MHKQPRDELIWTEFQHYFEAFVVGDVKKALTAEVGVGVIILTTVGIDCLGGYYLGVKSNRAPFVKFVKDFMPQYGIYADDIYTCIRNGLCHDYVINESKITNRRFLISGDYNEPHLVPSSRNKDYVYLNRIAYAEDFLKAQGEYFERAENDQRVWDNAVTRLIHKKSFLTVRP